MRQKLKYPVGVQSFEKLRQENYTYVDKTQLVYNLAQKNVCFLCRPRRFGKSLLISTLEAYFKGRRDLFEGLAIEQMETEWAEYPVFRIDFASGKFDNGARETEAIIRAKLTEFEAQYGASPCSETISVRLQYVFEQAHKQTGRRVVVLVDEYDKPLLDCMDTPLEDEQRSMLKAFYSTFKACDDHLRFVLLTGVTKFSQISVFSGFNQPLDISMSKEFDTICGISEEELYNVFAEPIHEMAEQYHTTEEEMKQHLKRRYDGYHFSTKMTDVYNPFSIINAFSNMQVEDYWFRSGTPTYLIRLLGGHNVNIQQLLSRDYSSKYFIDYRADVQDPLAMLYQSGYLTIKECLWEDGTYLLDFPNNEVRSGFVSLVSQDYFRNRENNESWVIGINRMLREGRLDDVRDSMTAFFASIPYEAGKDLRALDFETHFQYTFYLILRVLSCYTTLIEKQNSHGRADIIVEAKKYIYIFEFKLDGSADEALQQIEDKGYAQPYATDPRPIYKVGVNFSSTTRTIAEWKAKCEG